MVGIVLIIFAWGILILPGLAVARRLFPDDLRNGSLGTVSISYLCSFALLSPLVIPCYWLELPLWTFTSVIVVVVGVGAYDAIRELGTYKPSISISVVSVLGSLVLIADLTLSAIYGGYMDGDAAFHTSRIRMLTDHGFNNWDPYLYPHQFSSVYHTSIYHALIACISHFTKQSYLLSWSVTLLWAKLVSAASVFYVAIKIFRDRNAGWIALIAISLWSYNALPIHNPLRWHYLALPHNLVPLWMFPLFVGGIMDLWEGRSKNAWLKLATVLLVTAETHMLYSLFLCVFLGIFLCLWTIRTTITERRVRWKVIATCLILLTPLPFWILERYGARIVNHHGTEESPARVAHLDQPSPTSTNDLRLFDIPIKEIVHKSKDTKSSNRKLTFLRLSDGRKVVDPLPWTKPSDYHFWLAISFLLALSFRKKEVVWLACCVGIAMILLYHPSIFSILLSKLRMRDWAIGRIEAIFAIAGYVMIPNMAVASLGLIFSKPLGQLVIAMLMLNWGLRPRAEQQFEWPIVKRRPNAFTLASERVVLQRSIPVGSTVLADLVEAKRLVQLHNCYVIAANRMSPKLRGVTQRQNDVRYLLNSRHPWKTKHAILEKHRIRFLYTRTERTRVVALKSLKNHLDVRYEGSNGKLIASIHP
ncbi:MAG: hypothetical protein H6714_00195 [Myxococcales bacterium]|nr:hypothetical protein [Myxococcales bacterium]